MLATDGRDIHLSAIRWIIQHWSWASVGLCHYRLRSARLCFRHCRHCNHRLKVWVLTPLLLQAFLVNCSIPATSKPAYQQQADAHPIIPTNTSQTITDPRPIPSLGPIFLKIRSGFCFCLIPDQALSLFPNCVQQNEPRLKLVTKLAGGWASSPDPCGAQATIQIQKYK